MDSAANTDKAVKHGSVWTPLSKHIHMYYDIYDIEARTKSWHFAEYMQYAILQMKHVSYETIISRTFFWL